MSVTLETRKVGPYDLTPGSMIVAPAGNMHQVLFVKDTAFVPRSENEPPKYLLVLLSAGGGRTERIEHFVAPSAELELIL